MQKENLNLINFGEPCVRGNAKRAALDEKNDNAPLNQHKKRAILKDVTNVLCENPHNKSLNATNLLPKNQKHGQKGTVRGCKLASPVAVQHIPVDCETRMHQHADNAQFQSRIDKHGEGCSKESLPENQQGEKFLHDAKSAVSKRPDIIDIDNVDPPSCSLYAIDIFSNLQAMEILGRPTSTYMETIQQGIIDQGMRGFLVNWLVQICDDYSLGENTLYLTVHFVDAFLSKELFQRNQLQLLGITSMLIASKYEEMCAFCIDEICSIEVHTCTKSEVIALERRVLNTLGFRLAVPTAKTFLRRYVFAAHASYRNPSLEFKFLANYLAESTLIHYSFLEFLPSAIAASAVFLARWTQHQSDHPWNPTLEYYTNYKASDLKTIVHALQAVQLNRDYCPFRAVRDKYNQNKFKNVAALLSPELPDALFYSN